MKVTLAMFWNRAASIVKRPPALFAALAIAAAPGFALGQGGSVALHSPEAARAAEASEASDPTALERGRYAVVIDLDKNELYFKKGETTLWSATVGTGTGFRLQSNAGEWKFSTPTGVFQVQYKERDPVWIAPDWFFVSSGVAVPPQGDKRRYLPGALGAAAIFISPELAIHGTDRPELLGQRVSGGCIRLSNKDVLRLYHNVQVGTEVIIVGGKDLEERAVTPEFMMTQRARITATPIKPPPPDPVMDRWKAMRTPALLGAVQNELRLPASRSRWHEVVTLVVDRGLKNDEAALPGLMRLVTEITDEKREKEFGTFLAHAYARNPIKTLEALARLDTEERAEAAAVIVRATMHLYSGDIEQSVAPWPTSRVPRTAVQGDGRRGWDALARAETEMRAPLLGTRL
jgi:lipoprotein-anchoring transpeptidase ErfK/SrfK